MCLLRGTDWVFKCRLNSCFKLQVEGTSQRRPVFDPRSVRVRSVLGKVALRPVFLLVLPFLLVTIISSVLHTRFHLYGTLTKITVNLHAQWEAVWLLSAAFHHSSDIPKCDTQRHWERFKNFRSTAKKFAMQHLTFEGFVRRRADVRTEFYEQLKRRQLAASRIVRSESNVKTPSA